MSNSSHLKTLGIITIATGKYFQEFIPELKNSVDQYFKFSSYKINFYCLTDSNVSLAGVTNIPTKHYGWPFSTLLRYRWIKQYLNIFQEHDYLLYMDADMRVVSTPPESIFSYPIVAVRHPGYLHSPGAFEIDRQDSCYVPPPLRKNYYQGCFWGGQTANISHLITSLSKMVEDDLSLGNIPIWHDESYLNKYLSIHACHPLSPSYAWPESEPISQPPYVLHLEKKHSVIRQSSNDLLDISALINGADAASELEIYKRLYLNSHEKCQRLESRLVDKNLGISKIREWLSYFWCNVK